MEEKQVILSLRGVQHYGGEKPETIELITDGILRRHPTGWELEYEESALTGLEGVYTSFLIENDCVTLTRTGKLQSQMVFRKGVPHCSLYEMEFGAMMITVCATAIRSDLSMAGGKVDLKYTIDIEKTAAGTVDYHLKVKVK